MYQFKVCKLRKRGKSKRRLKINFFINRQFVASFLKCWDRLSQYDNDSQSYSFRFSSCRYFRKRAWHDSKATPISWISSLLCFFPVFFKNPNLGFFCNCRHFFFALFDHLQLFLTIYNPFWCFCFFNDLWSFSTIFGSFFCQITICHLMG